MLRALNRGAKELFFQRNEHITEPYSNAVITLNLLENPG